MTRLVGLVLLVIFSFSCTERIHLDLRNSDPVVVITGLITNEEKYHEVQVSMSAPYFSNEPNPVVSGAKVYIESSENETFELIENFPGSYRTKQVMAGKPGVTYTLRVECDSNEDEFTEVYEAFTTMPDSMTIDSLQIRQIKIVGMEFFTVNLFAQETPGEDYYLCHYFINGTLKTDRIRHFQVFDDRMYDGQYLEGEWIYDFPNGEYKDDFNIEEEDLDDIFFLYPGDLVILQISRIEKGYYQFIRDCIREQRGSNPMFGGPPANIHTNISNGGIGYFASYYINVDGAIAPLED